MMCQFSSDNSDDGDVYLDRYVVSMDDTFWYFRSILQSDRVINEDISHRIRPVWMKWR
jgi:hypothetical protein